MLKTAGQLLMVQFTVGTTRTSLTPTSIGTAATFKEGREKKVIKQLSSVLHPNLSFTG
jgi:hypothetical protein